MSGGSVEDNANGREEAAIPDDRDIGRPLALRDHELRPPAPAAVHAGRHSSARWAQYFWLLLWPALYFVTRKAAATRPA